MDFIETLDFGDEINRAIEEALRALPNVTKYVETAQ